MMYIVLSTHIALSGFQIEKLEIHTQKKLSTKKDQPHKQVCPVQICKKVVIKITQYPKTSVPQELKGRHAFPGNKEVWLLILTNLDDLV